MRVSFAVPILVLAVAGCGVLAALEDVPPAGDASWCADGEVAFFLLGTKEGADIGETDAPPPPGVDTGEDEGGGDPGRPPADAGRGIALTLGGGMAFPDGEMGSAPGRTIPSYSEIWTSSGAFEVLGEFGSGKEVNPYAQLSLLQFRGLKWTDPADPSDSWVASDCSLTLIAGGARFGRRYYGKAAVGVLLWPEVTRTDYFSGFEETILESGAIFAFVVGGGAELKLGPLKACVDVEYLLGTAAPEKGENAVVFWPLFEPGTMNSLKLAGRVGYSF